MALVMKKPHLYLQLTVGSLTVELRPQGDQQLARWMVAAIAHVSRKPFPPVLFRVQVAELSEIGVRGTVEGDPVWMPCKLLYVMGGVPLMFQLQVPAHFDDETPIAARSIKLA